MARLVRLVRELSAFDDVTQLSGPDIGRYPFCRTFVWWSIACMLVEKASGKTLMSELVMQHASDDVDVRCSATRDTA